MWGIDFVRGGDGLANFEFGLEDDVAGGAGVTVDAIEEDARGGGAELVARLHDGGEGRIGKRGEGEVVEAHDGNVLRAAEAELADGLNDAHGDHVVAGKDGGGTRKHAEEKQPAGTAAGEIERGFLEKFGGDGQTGFGHGAAEPAETLFGVGEMQRTGDGGNATVSELDEMTGGGVGSGFVGGGDAVAVPAFGQPVDTDDRGATLLIGLCLTSEVAEVGGDDDQSRRKISAELVEVDQLFGVVVIGVAEDKAVAVGEGGIFSAADDGGEKRVGYVGNDHADHVGFVATEATGEGAGLIADGLDGFFDAAAERLADTCRAIENMGDRTQRNAGHTRDLLHVRHGQRDGFATAEAGGIYPFAV